MEERDFLFDSIFPNAELFFLQVGDVPAVAIHNAVRNRDERGVDFDDVARIDFFRAGWCLVLLCFRFAIVGIVSSAEHGRLAWRRWRGRRSEEHTSELQSP